MTAVMEQVCKDALELPLDWIQHPEWMAALFPLYLEASTTPGDSGFPAFADFGYGPELIGLTSWGVNSSNPVNPYGSGLGDITYLTLFSTQRNWIMSVIPEPET